VDWDGRGTRFNSWQRRKLKGYGGGGTKTTQTNIIFVGRHVELWEIIETL
jgi:hypothetical protein